MNALSERLTPARTVCHAPGTSKKRLFETIAKMVCDDQRNLPYDEVLAPSAAHQLHVDILAMVARLFNQAAFCERLRAARDDRILYDIACSAAI